MRGGATSWDGDHPKALEAKAAWRFLRCAPPGVELRVSRLVSVRMCSQAHDLIVSVVFGTVCGEPAFDNDGMLVASANPWATTFFADFRALVVLDSAVGLVAAVGRASGRRSSRCSARSTSRS